MFYVRCYILYYTLLYYTIIISYTILFYILFLLPSSLSLSPHPFLLFYSHLPLQSSSSVLLPTLLLPSHLPTIFLYNPSSFPEYLSAFGFTYLYSINISFRFGREYTSISNNPSLRNPIFRSILLLLIHSIRVGIWIHLFIYYYILYYTLLLF